MCGVAGAIDLTGRREPDRSLIESMAATLFHRGPDEDGYLYGPGYGVAHRRLSIVGLADDRQPIFNEDGTVAVIFNGELFDYREQRRALEQKGHVFRTSTDTEIIVHLYEEHGEDVFEHLKGQFAVVLLDLAQRKILLGRDRFGICPLHWARQRDWMFFGSEAKAIVASGAVEAECDPRGLGHVLTFFALGTRRTMFAGVQSILPGTYLRVAFNGNGLPAEITERRYWDLDFPDQGQEENPSDITPLVDEFDAAFTASVERRLQADVPVVSYLSGGVDSAYVLATAAKIRGHAPPTFTVRVTNQKLDETSDAMITARHVGAHPTVVDCDRDLIAGVYPRLVAATDSPVIDTSCAALWALSREVHRQDYKVALTGEGADEAFGSYVWFKINAMMQALDAGPFKPSRATSRIARKALAPHMGMTDFAALDEMAAGPHAQTIKYQALGAARHKYMNPALRDVVSDRDLYEDIPLDVERMRRWHPLNRSLYFGYKVHLPGLLLNHKGDRVAMANSVETRYPFLDEAIVDLSARLHPSLKLRGFTGDKFLLRHAAARVLPKEIAFRPKGMFRAPFAESFLVEPQSYVRQLMSPESLAKTGYFDVAQVRRDFEAYTSGRASSWKFFSSMALCGVVSTQLWHHLYLGGGLCDLPVKDPAAKVLRAPSKVAA